MNRYKLFAIVTTSLITISAAFSLALPPLEFRVKSSKVRMPRDKKYQIGNDKTDKLDKIIATSRNHLGFRGEMPPKKIAGTLTIVAAGGSTTACEYISDGKTWCDLLAEKLKRKYPHIWLNNGGIDGISTFGLLVYLEDYLTKIKPQMVLFLLGGSDIGLNDYSLWDLGFLKKPMAGYLASSLEKVTNLRPVLDFGINLYKFSQAKRLGLVNPVFDFARLEPVATTREQAESLLRSHQEKYLGAFGQRLTRLIEICRENSMEPVFITQPLVFGGGIDPVTGVDLGKVGAQATDGKTLWQMYELYNQVVRDTASEHGVRLIDLAREMPKTSEFFYDTIHFSNAGCAAAAEILDKHLEPYLEKKYPQLTKITFMKQP
jgi:lysophospholipase L1-like esterase